MRIYKSVILIIPILLAGFFTPSSFVFGKEIDNSWLVVFKSGEIKTINLPENKKEQEIILKKWRVQKDVKYVEQNFSYKGAILPSDQYFSEQWYLKRIKAYRAWDVIKDAPDVVVAVVDSGVQTYHPDLQDNIWFNRGEIPNNGLDDDNNGYIDDYNGYDFVNNTPDPGPKFKPGYTEEGVVHGTIVAGVLGARGQNNIGIAGVAWKIKIMPLKALDDMGVARTDKVIAAINYAIKKKVQIINLSFVGESYSQALQDAIRKAYDAGIIVVAAGGNELGEGFGLDLNTKPLYPVCMDGNAGENMVIGVGATNVLDNKVDFSGYGKCIDIVAPGVSIYSTSVYDPRYLNNEEVFNKYYDGYWSGTSLAVPQVSGVLALILQSNQSLKSREAVNILLKSADNIDALNINFIGKLGSGRLNVENSIVNSISSISPYKPNLVLANHEKLGLVEIVSGTTTLARFQAFAAGTPVNVIAGDLNIDGQAEIVVAPMAGYKPEVKIFDQKGKLLKTLLVYPNTFLGGVNVAVGDVNGDGRSEIIVAPGSNYKPEIKIFTWDGKLIKSFMAYDTNFKNGISVAAGDTNGNGVAKIVVVPASKGPAQVRVFSSAGKVLSQFYAYDKKIIGGYKVAIADVRSWYNNQSFILVAPNKGLEPVVEAFNNDGVLLKKFAAYNLKFLGGVNVAAGELDKDGVPEIITAPAIGGPANVSWYKISGKLIKSYFVSKTNVLNGVGLAIFYSK